MAGGAERLAIDICNELEKRKDIEVKLLVLSNLNEFDKGSISFNTSIINSYVKLSLYNSNVAELTDSQRPRSSA